MEKVSLDTKQGMDICRHKSVNCLNSVCSAWRHKSELEWWEAVKLLSFQQHNYVEHNMTETITLLLACYTGTPPTHPSSGGSGELLTTAGTLGCGLERLFLLADSRPLL